MDVYTANYSARANADAKLRPSSSAASLYSASPSRKELRSRPRPEIAYADEMPRFVGSPMVSSYAAQFLRNSCAILRNFLTRLHALAGTRTSAAASSCARSSATWRTTSTSR